MSPLHIDQNMYTVEIRYELLGQFSTLGSCLMVAYTKIPKTKIPVENTLFQALKITFHEIIT